jgi:hypothetical protein
MLGLDFARRGASDKIYRFSVPIWFERCNHLNHHNVTTVAAAIDGVGVLGQPDVEQAESDGERSPRNPEHGSPTCHIPVAPFSFAT